MTRKAVVLDIRIILVNSVLHAKQKGFAEQAVHTNLLTKCSLCSECTLHCSDFVEDVCSVKNKPPYVCNGCSQLSKCTLLKRIYDPADAHERAHHAVSEARTGIMSNEDDIARINGIISPLVKNGQSLHQIYLAHVDELMCSEKTLYNYVDAQLFDIRNIDLPRKVKYRPRYKKPEFKVDRAAVLNEATLTFKNIWEQTRKRPLYKWIA